MVIDTMVFGYALLGVTRFCDEAAEVLEQSEEIAAPDSVRAELANVVTQWVREEDVELETGIEVLRDADALISRIIPTNAIWERAVELAIDGPHATYDTLFVAAAEMLDTQVVTYDQKLRRRFPDIVIMAADFLG